MPDRDFDAIFYVKSIPDITFEDGQFHICYRTGRTHFEFVMRPNTFLKAVRNANKVADELHGADVVGIKDRRG